jgi:hypothetical protein
VSPEEIARFFVRARRDQDTERWDVRLDAALREILERANDFVPSEAGGILLDDPRAKLAGIRTPRLTFIAVYGPNSAQLLGRRVPSERGFVGEVYRAGQAARADRLTVEDPLLVTDRDRVVAELSPPRIGRAETLMDACLAELVRGGLISPPTRPRGSPPGRRPVAPTEELLAELQADRDAR